jgi:hypothetical protein
MKAIGLTQFGGPEVLQVVDLPMPEGPAAARSASACTPPR